jgi:hypothetical protein
MAEDLRSPKSKVRLATSGFTIVVVGIGVKVCSIFDSDIIEPWKDIASGFPPKFVITGLLFCASLSIFFDLFGNPGFETETLFGRSLDTTLLSDFNFSHLV